MANVEELESRVEFLERVLQALLGVKPGRTVPEEYLATLSRRLKSEDIAADDKWESRLAQLVQAQTESTRHLSAFLHTLGRDFGRSMEGLAYVVANRAMRFESAIESSGEALRDLRENRIPAVESQLKNLQSVQTVETTTIHAYLVALGLGLDLARVPLQRFVPVRIYLQEQSRSSVARTSDAVVAFLDELGFRPSDDFPEETGSWFKKWFAKSSSALSQPQVIERLQKGERALELEYLHCKQAEADKNQAEGAAALIRAVSDQRAAVCQIGSILLVKSTDSLGHSHIVTRTLNQAEIIALEKHPGVLKSPADVLAFLDKVKLASASREALPPSEEI